ncbi:MAG: hypothetical protein CMJ83_12290, partial [Planctomycetes bacterium]|nr:hypothetical protein [Planctomycetota bacterium]
MPQIQYSLRFAPVIFVLVLSGRLLAQDPPALTLDGKPVDAAALDALAKTARAALENLKQTPPADADAAKARRERLERELGLVQRAKATLERLASSAKREADLQREIQAATAAAKAARAASEEPPKFVSMTEEELNAIVAAEKKALSEKSRSAATLTAADTHIAGRTSAFEGVAPAITKADAALAAARKALEGVSDPGVQAQRRHEIRLAGLGVGVLVLERDHHPQLLKLDTLERDLARLKDQIATAESRTAAVRLKAARTARSETLAEESAAAKRKADRKKADAEAARLKDLPVAQATFTLQGLVASVDAAGKTEAATLERLTRIVTTLDEAMVSIARRNDIVQKLFPAGADLDEWKLAALIEERRRLEAAQDRFDSTLSELASDVETRRRETLNTRNRLENLDALVDPGGGPRTREMSSFYLRGFDLDQDAFLDACAAFDGGEPKDRRLFNSRFESAIENLQKHIEGRTRRLSETEKFLDQFDALARSIQVALDDRLRHLDSISFWLRVPLPLGGAERAAAMTELSAIGGAAGGVVAHLDVAFPTWEDRAGGRTGLLALIVGWIGLALVGGRVLQRRRRATTQIPAVAEVPGTPHRILPWAAGRLATPVLLALGGWLLAQSAPEEPVADLLLAVAAALLGARLTTTIAGALFGCPGQVAAVSCEQRTAHAAHRFLRLTGIAASCLLPAAWLLERQGAPRLALLVRLLVGIWCVLLSAWLIFRRDVLAVLTPRRGGLVTRTIRVLMPYAWPGSVAFYAAVISLCLMGYRHAAWHYGSRLLFCGAALI